MRKRVAVGLAWIAVVALSGGMASGQSTSGPAGHWEGTISVQSKELKVSIDLVSRTPDRWEGAAAFPEMNATELVLAPITVQGESVTFTVKGAPGDPTFTGTLSKDGKTLAGDFTQGPAAGTFMLTLKGEAKLEPAPKNAAVGKDVEGTWEGALDVGGKTLRLTLKLANEAGGSTGMLISVDQGGTEIPLKVIEQVGTQLKFTVPAVGGSYQGDLKEGQLVGSWTQGPGTLPLTFKRPAK
jgi:hypothetical protein